MDPEEQLSTTRTFVAIGLVLGVHALATEAAAQVLPIERSTPYEVQYQTLLKERTQDLNGVLERLRAAWTRRDVRGVTELYLPNARLGLPTIELDGREDIQETLERVLPTMSDFRIAVDDVEAGGRLIYASGRYSYLERPPQSSARIYEGRFFLLLYRESDRWWIKSLVFSSPATNNVN
jgi:hypothetical protein